ncbi:MAG TPA: hypothetical protein ENJ32_06455 [Crenotrichaceae bacterium]|nr:hypothetical protein [Crenotrichaceae bacterium]
MTEITRPAAFFIADNPALDFLNTVAAPTGKEIDWLSNGSDLLDWLEQAELVSSNHLKQFQDKNSLKQCDAIAAQARDLREWFRGFVTTYAGSRLSAAQLPELKPINTLLARDSCYLQINAEIMSEMNTENYEQPLRWRQERRWRTADDLLLPLAEVIGNLICSADFKSVKACEGATCTLWFLDVSKNHSRRWCTMAICGNRAKAAQYRAKKKLIHSESGSD